MALLSAGSVDAVVCDPPYGLGFMGKQWDSLPPGREWAEECLRVLKPGGHLLAFGGTRTYHRLACAIEDAGFEIRDTVCWLYGSGFPKSLDVGKAIDKAAGADRKVVGQNPNHRESLAAVEQRERWNNAVCSPNVTAPASPDAQRWDGWGTALKPAFEPVVVARKPLVGTVAANVLEFGVGGLNVDGCRVEAHSGDYAHSGNAGIVDNTRVYGSFEHKNQSKPHASGRWPANVVLDEVAAGLLDEQTRGKLHSAGAARNGSVDPRQQHRDRDFQGPKTDTGDMYRFGDSGGASRFFYCAKASKRERNAGLEGLPAKQLAGSNKWTDVDYRRGSGEVTAAPQQNHHPTVKPVALMRWLVRLVTPPGGVVLDPFMGSGSTGIACVLEGFDFVGIERELEYLEIARARIAAAEGSQLNLAV
jgi:DNA modification methylase